MSGLVVRDVVVDGRRVDLRAEDGVVVEIGDGIAAARGGDSELDGHGGAAIPGLHDHHVHLSAMAAADRSIRVGDDLDTSLRGASGRGWLRVVGYDEARHGTLDRHRLDALTSGREARVQHRSGAMWLLSSAALDAVGPLPDVPGVERDERGEPTGRLFRMDDWLARRISRSSELPDVTAVARRLASYGVTGVTDATPSTSLDDVRHLATAASVVRVVAMGGPALADATFPPEVERGPVKIVLGDHALPSLEEAADDVRVSHAAGRPVAVHCVTRAALALAIATWNDAGVMSGDRVEHASVAPPDLVDEMARLGLSVVTQPAFVGARGDTYLSDVDPDDVPHLYRCASLIAAGICVAFSSDAPFGPEDPWTAMRAAVQRATASGKPLGVGERVDARAALSMFYADRSLRIERGAPCHLVVLDCPLDDALHDLDAAHVRATVHAGTVTYARDG